MSTNPRCSSDHGHDRNYYAEDAPREDRRWSMVDTTMLESAYDCVDEPCDTRGSTTRVDTTEMLKKTSEEDTDGEW